jgi:lipopolysaccharide export system protein LptA
VLKLQSMYEQDLPHMEDGQVYIRAEKIEVELETLEILASGAVKTELQANDRQAVGKLPGLLVQGQPAYANAEELNYSGKHGRGSYDGNAQLWQGETALRANRILLDRSKGDLMAIGNARSLILFREGMSIGEANEIYYEEAVRRIQYLTKNSGSSEESLATLSGPQGNLSARKIVALLSTNENRVNRLEAHDQVTVRLDSPPDMRVATGENLVYYAADERYVISSPAIKPVKVIEKCREIIGQTLTFFKTADRITVDGNNTTRTQTSAETPCQEAGTF